MKAFSERSLSAVSHYGRNVTKLPSRPTPQLKFKGAADAEDVCPSFHKGSRSENQGISELRILSDKKAVGGDALQIVGVHYEFLWYSSERSVLV